MIRCLAQLVAADLPEASRNRLRLQHLQSANDRILQMLEAELRDDSNEDKQPATSVHIPTLVAFVCGVLRDHSQERGVELVADCVDASIRGELRKLEEAFLNVVANAVEATPRGGEVGICTSTSAEGDHYWRISDTGPGIPREVVATAGRRRISARAGGTGLGLSIAAATAQAHGGLLAIEVHGGGTIVTFWLPADPTKPSNPDERMQEV